MTAVTGWPSGLRVVPVVTVGTLAAAVPLARALSAGGLPVIEVTLRTSAALEAISAIRAELPDVLCGVGTLRSPGDVKAAVDAGAQFLVSPGSTEVLLDAMQATGLLCLPGAATASEAMHLLERDLRWAKFFPAESVGGAAALRSLAGPLSELTWCATGGITRSNAADYLDLPNVCAVGGSWMVPSSRVDAEDWDAISQLAAEASLL